MRRTIILWAALALASCGGCRDGEPGDSCNPDVESSCGDGLVCAANDDGDDVCLYPLTAPCDPDRDEDLCEGDGTCVAVEEEDIEGRCLVARSGSCEETEECAPGLVCADAADADGANCWADVVLRGRVFDAADEEAIEGAHLIALDDESTAVSDVAVSGAGGEYELSIPVARDADGKPVDEIFTLRASAQDYQTFPGGIRTALPIDASTATEEDGGPWVIQNAVTDVALIILPEGERGRASVSGFISSDVRKDGVLVVAESGGEGYSAVSSISGYFTIFNVPDGTHEVRGYAAGVQLEPVDVTVDGEPVTDVELADAGDTTVTVDGSIQLVNGGQPTSVVLVVESTFQENFARGEVPSGLRAPKTGPPSIDGAWSIEGVPVGRYVVLAAFENDESVRDPDQAIAGTAIVRITVAESEDQTVGESFKVTEALDVFGPGAEQPQAVTSPPLLRWEDDSSETHYEVRVYNAYGEEVWQSTVDGVSGSDEVSVQYAGPFEDGMYYQFRATSFRTPGGNPTPISTTEDLRGVFYKPAGE